MAQNPGCMIGSWWAGELPITVNSLEYTEIWATSIEVSITEISENYQAYWDAAIVTWLTFEKLTNHISRVIIFLKAGLVNVVILASHFWNESDS